MVGPSIFPLCFVSVAAVVVHLRAVGGASLSLDHGVVVQLFEWPYRDIARECEKFLAHHGYSAVQISPPQENLIIAGRPWWERYQTVSYKLRTRSDAKKDLIDMIKRCNSVGVRIIVDIVINHMTAASNSCIGTAGSVCIPSSLFYPAVPYLEEDFHHPICDIRDYSNETEVRVCRFGQLNDLNQTRPNVQEKIVTFMNGLIQLGAAGFRVDAAKYMYPSDLKAIYDRLDDLNIEHGFPPYTKPFIYQEVMAGGAVKPQDYTHIGLVTDYNVSSLLAFSLNGLLYLKDLQNYGQKLDLLPANVSYSFLENHDLERLNSSFVLTYKNHQLYKMAIAFLLARGRGTLMIMSGYNFTDGYQGPPHNATTYQTLPPVRHNRCVNNWLCQHRWPEIYGMVDFYSAVRGANIGSWWDNGKNQIAFCKYGKGFIAINRETRPMDELLQTCLPGGTYTDVISGQPMEVDMYGMARVVLPGYYPGSTVYSFMALLKQANKNATTTKRGLLQYQTYYDKAL